MISTVQEAVRPGNMNWFAPMPFQLTPPPKHSSIEVRQADGRVQVDFPAAGMYWYFPLLLIVGIIGLSACIQQWAALFGVWPGAVLDISTKFRITLTGLMVILVVICIVAMIGRHRIFLTPEHLRKQIRCFGIPLISLNVVWANVHRIEPGVDAGNDPVLWLQGDGNDRTIIEGFHSAEERDWFCIFLESYRSSSRKV